MIPVGPRIRASHCQATLRALDRRAPGTAARVLARLDPECRAGLTDAMKGSFVPASWDVALVEAIRAEVGPAATREVLRGMMKASLSGALLGGLLRTAQSLFGRSPEGLLRWAGHAYAHVTRGCGDVLLESAQERSVTLRMTAMPAPLAVPAYLDAIAGAIEAVFDACGVEGSVTLRDVAGDGARYVVEWRGPAGSS